MEAITSSRTSAIDENCECLGVKRLQLMENAGTAVANAVKKKMSSGKVIIFAGRGNNGRDAFVAARRLENYDTTVILVGRKEEIRTQEARHNAFEAAYAAAFINGVAGDMAFAEFGYGLLATDVIDNIPKVMYERNNC